MNWRQRLIALVLTAFVLGAAGWAHGLRSPEWKACMNKYWSTAICNAVEFTR